MATAHPTTGAILEEFGRDPEALAAEIVALRRVVAELRSLHDESRAPIVVISPSERPPAPSEPWPPIVPRAVVQP